MGSWWWGGGEEQNWGKILLLSNTKRKMGRKLFSNFCVMVETVVSFCKILSIMYVITVQQNQCMLLYCQCFLTFHGLWLHGNVCVHSCKSWTFPLISPDFQKQVWNQPKLQDASSNWQRDVAGYPAGCEVQAVSDKPSCEAYKCLSNDRC